MDCVWRKDNLIARLTNRREGTRPLYLCYANICTNISTLFPIDKVYETRKWRMVCFLFSWSWWWRRFLCITITQYLYMLAFIHICPYMPQSNRSKKEGWQQDVIPLSKSQMGSTSLLLFCWLSPPLNSLYKTDIQRRGLPLKKSSLKKEQNDAISELAKK